VQPGELGGSLRSIGSDLRLDYFAVGHQYSRGAWRARQSTAPERRPRHETAAGRRWGPVGGSSQPVEAYELLAASEGGRGCGGARRGLRRFRAL
jgi:hypothetical protein